jgi:hypothetical protein
MIMRALIHFPVIHDSYDLGSFSQTVTQSQAPQQLQQHQLAIERFWLTVVSVIEGLELNYAQLKLYQDGLPVCDKETEIVNEVAASGSRNYKLLQYLQQKGAQIIGTESPDLLFQEYSLIKQSAQSEEKAQLLLNQRDDYIAQRINNTLQEEEMGILFLGILHNIEDKLAKDIVLIQPLGKPTNVEIKKNISTG